MAKRYRKIDPRIWQDERFAKLKRTDKLIAFYLITGQSNRIGLYRLSLARAAEDLDLGGTRRALACLLPVVRSLHWFFHKESGVVYIPTWWKYNPPENEKHLIGNLKDLADLPKNPYLTAFKRNTRYLPESLQGRYRIAIGIALRHGMPYQEQEQKQEQKQKGLAYSYAGRGSGGGGTAASRTCLKCTRPQELGGVYCAQHREAEGSL